jgi:hypothetical protein
MALFRSSRRALQPDTVLSISRAGRRVRISRLCWFRRIGGVSDVRLEVVREP